MTTDWIMPWYDVPADTKEDKVQRYYNTLESRLGYRLVLGGTRHFGYWEHDTRWPFPLSRALRSMEDKLASALALPPGAHVLDAGCGEGHVALRMAAEHGLRVSGIDLVPHHVDRARRNMAASGLSERRVSVRLMDYHDLDLAWAETLDGVYTMETFVHARDPQAVLGHFFRLLRPGGRIAMFEYDHVPMPDGAAAVEKDKGLSGKDHRLLQSMQQINDLAAMPTNACSTPGVFKDMLERAGFVDVEVRDYSDHIAPMRRFFWALGIVPYYLVRLLRLQRHFINTVAGVEMHRGAGKWRYVAISARKPGELGRVRQGQ